MASTTPHGAMPELPEAEAWRTRHKSEPGMIGHYPWSYTGRKPKRPMGASYETDDLFTTDQMREYAIAAIAGQVDAERFALICDQVAADLGGVAEGPFVTDFGKHTHQSMAAGAMNCAAAIRAKDAKP